MPGYWKREVNNVSFFRYLNPPMISEVYKTTCVLNFYIIYCCRRLLSWYRQLCSIDITMIAQKLTLRISPPKLPCTGTAPVAAINLKFLGYMPRFILGKVRKFQDPSSNRFWDIQEKPEGWIKTTPLPLIGLTRALLGLWIFHRLLGGGVWTPPPHDLGSWSP